MLQADLAAVWQERDQHRNAATIGAVDVWAKFQPAKSAPPCGPSIHTENDERTAQQRHHFCLSDGCRQKRDDEPTIDWVTHERIGASIYDFIVLLAGITLDHNGPR